MHQGEATGDVLRLVALQVPDQVPRRAAAGRGVDLLQRLLYAVLTQVGEARGARRRYGVQPEPLGHGDDRHRMRPAAGRLTSSDFGPHVGQSLRQRRKIHNRKN